MRYPSRLVPLFLREYARRGQDAGRLITAFDLPADSVDLPEVVVGVGVLEDLSAEMAVALRDRDVGLTFARELGRGEYGLIQFLLEVAPTLGESIEALVKHPGSVSQFVVHTFERQGDSAMIRQSAPGHPGCLGRHGNEFGIAMILRTGWELLGERVEPTRAWFAHPAPRDLSGLTAFFGGTPLSFEAGSNGLEFPAHLLNTRTVKGDPPLHRALDVQLGEPAQPPPDPFAAQAARAIERALAQGAPRIEAVAKLLHLSPRTLQRRLEELGSSFRERVEQVREAAAKRLLTEGRLTVAEVADRLGYQGAGAFSRAFRRWTGRAPGIFQRESRRG